MTSSSKSSMNTYGVTKFDGKGDFWTWKLKIEAVLKKERVFKIVSDLNKIVGKKDVQFEDMGDDDLIFIQLCLFDEVLRELSHIKEAEKLQNALEKIYQDKSLTNHIIIRQQLYSFRMKFGVTLSEYMDTLTILIMDLKVVDVDISDEDAGSHLIMFITFGVYNVCELHVIYGRSSISLFDVKIDLHNEALRGRLASSESVDSDY